MFDRHHSPFGPVPPGAPHHPAAGGSPFGPGHRTPPAPPHPPNHPHPPEPPFGHGHPHPPAGHGRPADEPAGPGHPHPGAFEDPHPAEPPFGRPHRAEPFDHPHGADGPFGHGHTHGPGHGGAPFPPDDWPEDTDDEAGAWRAADAGGYPPVPPGPPAPPFGPPHRPPFPPMGPPFGGPGGFRRGPRVRRGDVRAAILALLAEQPRNGYQLIQEIARRSGGVWRPSPGSVYPALAQLADEDLVRDRGTGNRRDFELTDAGRRYVEEHPEELAAPWANAAETVSDEPTELWQSLSAVHAAAVQVAQAGSAGQAAAARRVLDTARRDIYRILADDPGDED